MVDEKNYAFTGGARFDHTFSAMKEGESMKKIITLVALFSCICGAAFAMTFSQPDKLVYFSQGNAPARVTTKAPDGQAVAFEYFGKYVKLISADGKADYLSFISYDGYTADFRIRTLTTHNPAMKLWEIKAIGGAMHGSSNSGYWLVGQKNGKFVTYISLDSLTDMGYGKDSAFPYHSLVTRVLNGRYYIDANHEVMPSGAQYGYELQNLLDFSVRADWDANAQWFTLTYENI